MQNSTVQHQVRTLHYLLWLQSLAKRNLEHQHAILKKIEDFTPTFWNRKHSFVLDDDLWIAKQQLRNINNEFLRIRYLQTANEDWATIAFNNDCFDVNSFYQWFENQIKQEKQDNAAT